MNSALFWLTLIGVGVWFWRSNMQVREQAVFLSRRVCKSYGLQLLDDTVSLSRLRLGRTGGGRVAFRRIYEFEYSADGHTRRAGSIALIGSRLESIYLDESLPSSATDRPM